MTESNENKDEKLYAGKFKTVEELEAGYKNAAVVFDENTNLKKQIEDITTVPHDYITPTELSFDDNRISDIKARAKEAGLTQAQYEKLIHGDKNRVENYKKNFDTARKELGEDNMNILTDYVKKHYPKEIQDNVLNTFIGNKEARQGALRHREELLNNRVPGIGKPSFTNYNVSQEDINKAYAAKEKNKSDLRARNHYMNLLKMRSEQEAS